MDEAAETEGIVAAHAYGRAGAVLGEARLGAEGGPEWKPRERGSQGSASRVQ